MSFPPGTEMFQFPGFASRPYVFRPRYPCGWVAPFGYPRINACSRLPMAFRSVPRPSSPPGAKASTECPYRAQYVHLPVKADATNMHRNHPRRNAAQTYLITWTFVTQHTQKHLFATSRTRANPITIDDTEMFRKTPLNVAARVAAPPALARACGQTDATRARPETHQNLIHTDKEHGNPNRDHQATPPLGDTALSNGNTRPPLLQGPARHHRTTSTSLRRHASNPEFSTPPAKSPMAKPHWWKRPTGGDDRDRTDDPLLAKQVLSQLSYAPKVTAFAIGNGPGRI